MDNFHRNHLIRAGAIVPHQDLEVQILDDAYGPSWSQPWHRDDPGLRLDAAGKFWAEVDVNMETATSLAAWLLQTNRNKPDAGQSAPRRLRPARDCLL